MKDTTNFNLALNSNQIKLIAIIAMTIDHLAWTFFPGFQPNLGVVLLHCIGRITAPIMWYFIAEGYHYTHNIKKYATRLFAFAFISHFAYNFCFSIPFVPFKNSIFNQTSIMWSLAWGLVALYIVDSKDSKLTIWMKSVLVLLICVITFSADWSCIPVLVIIHIGTNHGNFKKQMIGLIGYVAIYGLGYAISHDITYGILQMAVVLSIPILAQYNGKRGTWKGMKWLFYVYYPLHLLLCGIFRIILEGKLF